MSIVVITTTYVLRKLHLSISIAYVQKVLCPFIRFRILAKIHVLVEVMDIYLSPEVGISKDGRNNLCSSVMLDDR